MESALSLGYGVFVGFSDDMIYDSYGYYVDARMPATILSNHGVAAFMISMLRVVAIAMTNAYVAL